MRPIQMVDLKQQYTKIKSEVDSAIREILENASFINGKAVTDLAEGLSAYTGSKHTIPCANGTDALQIAMMALDLQPGDEVITPSFTYIATTEVVALLRLKPVFAEVDPKTFCLDPAALEKAITPRTRAIVPVHLYGQSAPMEEIMKIAARHGLYVIEDNAQALGSECRFGNGETKKDRYDRHHRHDLLFSLKEFGLLWRRRGNIYGRRYVSYATENDCKPWAESPLLP